jgi:hypothetical protein
MVVFFLIFFLSSYSIKAKPHECKKIINEEKGIKVIENSNYPIFGDLILELQEDLVIKESEIDEKLHVLSSIRYGSG